MSGLSNVGDVDADQEQNEEADDEDERCCQPAERFQTKRFTMKHSVLSSRLLFRAASIRYTMLGLVAASR